MNYFLKNADATRVYRVAYQSDEGRITVTAAYACATGVSATLPNGNTIDTPDQVVDVAQVLVDAVLNDLVEGTVEEYRALAKTMIDAEWA